MRLDGPGLHGQRGTLGGLCLERSELVVKLLPSLAVDKPSPVGALGREHVDGSHVPAIRTLDDRALSVRALVTAVLAGPVVTPPYLSDCAPVVRKDRGSQVGPGWFSCWLPVMAQE